MHMGKTVMCRDPCYGQLSLLKEAVRERRERGWLLRRRRGRVKRGKIWM